jgi:AraC-like DNA-binding protein
MGVCLIGGKFPYAFPDQASLKQLYGRCHLNKQDDLTLSLARLKFAEESEQTGEGLVFVFCKSGIGQYTSKLTAHRLSPGDVLVFTRTAGSKISAQDNKGEFLFWSFSVRFENLTPLFGCKEISLLHSITEAFISPKIYPASSSLAVECQYLLKMIPSQFNLDHRGQLIRIAATILSAEFEKALSQRNGFATRGDHVFQAFESLSASEFINLSVGELAGRFNCSRRHLNRLFHQHFGTSVIALRMEIRLLKAASLLRDGNAKIINVAEQCGFNHLGLFNTCFKRRFGTSPGQWRKSNYSAKGMPARRLEHPPSPSDSQFGAISPFVMTALTAKISKPPNRAGKKENLRNKDLMHESQTS